MTTISQSNESIVLDTVVLVHALRDDDLWKHIERENHLLSRAEKPLVPIVCVGELLALGRMWNWGPQKQGKLESLVGQLTLVDIHSRPVLERYGEIKAFLRSKIIPQNDIWIAAITSVSQGCLITCDRDFDRLIGNTFPFQRICYAPNAGNAVN